MISTTRKLVTGAAMLLFPIVGSAQLVVGTGVLTNAALDTRWSIAQVNGPIAPGVVISSPPGSWQANVPGSYRWLGVAASGTGGNGNYRGSTQFSLGATDFLSLSLRCAVDNTPIGVFLNGLQVAGTCGTFGFGQQFTLASFIAGINTLEFRWTGDGTTDGFLVSVDNMAYRQGPPVPGIVPEPSTYLLMATGMAFLTLVARRRRGI